MHVHACREAKYLQLIGVHVPEAARTLLLQEEKFNYYFAQLSFAVSALGVAGMSDGIGRQVRAFVEDVWACDSMKSLPLQRWGLASRCYNGCKQ